MKIFTKIAAAALAAIFFALPVSADTYDVYIPIWKRKSGGATGSIGHAPMHLPIEATFDDATGVLTVSAPDDLEGLVYVYNISGGLEVSSDHHNCTLTLPQTSGIHILSLQGESWIGEAKMIF